MNNNAMYTYFLTSWFVDTPQQWSVKRLDIKRWYISPQVGRALELIGLLGASTASVLRCSGPTTRKATLLGVEKFELANFSCKITSSSLCRQAKDV